MNMLHLRCVHNQSNSLKNLPPKLTNESVIARVQTLKQVKEKTKLYIKKYGLTAKDFNGKLYIKNSECVVDITGKIFNKQNEEITNLD